MYADKVINSIDKFMIEAGPQVDDKFADVFNFLAGEKKKVAAAVKFSFGVDAFPDSTPTEFVMLPFDLCFYGIKRPSGGVECVLLEQIDDDTISARLFLSTTDGGIDSQLIEVIINRAEPSPAVMSRQIPSISAHDDDSLRQLTDRTASWAIIASSILACSNITYIDNIPSKFKQSRVKKGRSPLFEYKTLHLKQDRTQNTNSGGGSHSSPRLHLRRGHIRRISQDKSVWVQSCMVGSKRNGVVKKDYSIGRQ